MKVGTIPLKLRKQESQILTDLIKNNPHLKSTNKDLMIVRDLAKKVKEISQLPENVEKIKLWKDHNSLIKTRPLVLCLPEDSYGEILPYRDLKSSNPFIREYEWYLRSLIYHWEELKDDYVVTSRLKVPVVFSIKDGGLKEINEYPKNIENGSVRYKKQIIEEKDIEKLKFPKLIYDRKQTKNNLDFVTETFNGILDVQLYFTIIPMHLSPGMMGLLARLRGLDQILIDMIDRPKWVHKAMRFLTDGILNLMKDVESRRLLGLNNLDDCFLPGGFGYTDELPGKDFKECVRFKDLWQSAESQELEGVSPEMMDEFLLPYQIEVLENYGLSYYGCCENLSNKFNIIKKISNLRRVTVAPWTNMIKAVEELGNKYVYVWKPNPSDVAMDTFDEEMIKKKIRQGFEITRESVTEIILRTIQTTRNDPDRLKKWSEIAKELSYKYI